MPLEGCVAVLEGVYAGYSGSVVLKDVELCVPKGLMVVLGPNGSGKTTLLRVMAGLHKPLKGRVLVGGVDVYGVGARDRARLVSYAPPLPVSQGLGQPLVEFVAAAMYYRKPLPGLGPGREDLELAERLLAELGLGKLAHRSLSAVSSGEAQRAMVAHALAKKTPLVALDEPTSFQDPHGKMLVYAMLAREAEKRAVVVATHDLLFAALNAASIAMLKNGEVIAAGPPERVLNASNLEELYGAKVAEATVTIGGRRLALPLPLEAL